MNCLFCKIARGEIPAARLYEDDQVVAFSDLNPQAPVHVLIVPRIHLDSLLALDDPALALAMLNAAKTVAREKGIDETGFRLLTNVGEDGGQSVPHLHWHLLGGRRMEWPPG
ncbi:MAG TPA: histidine triad nucleotide-binding protein [Cyanobacteria bacterium UBA8530]|nr:histidine triad nucleotide-binding protein [Cyanobacteria bacterium UBA8530]